MSRVSKGAMNGIMECHKPLSIQQERRSTSRKSDKYHLKITPIKKGYVTVRCGNAPNVAFNNVSGERMRLASSIQRHPR